MEAFYCLDCKKEAESVLDHRTGDTICTDCGLVLESHCIDQTPEWRTFADESDGRDPTRVGGPSNPFLNRSTLTTVISNSCPGSKPLTSTLNRLQKLDANPDEKLIKGFQIIAAMTEKLGLSATIKDRANEIFAKNEESKNCKGKKAASFCAACLFIACRELKLSRTLKEISTVAEGASMKDINKACGQIKRKVEVDMGAVDVKELIRRFCSNLSMSQRGIKAVQEGVQKSEEFDIRRNPKSVLAAIIYMITQLSDEDKKSLREISAAAEVAEVTIKKSYKDIYPYASRLTPNWYANEEDIKTLCSP